MSHRYQNYNLFRVTNLFIIYSSAQADNRPTSNAQPSLPFTFPHKGLIIHSQRKCEGLFIAIKAKCTFNCLNKCLLMVSYL